MSEHPTHLRAVPTPERQLPTIVGISDPDQAAFRAWADLHDHDPDQLRRFGAAYCGEYKSKEDWALDVVLSLDITPKLNAAVPKWFGRYLSIDLAAIAKDFVALGEVTIVDNPDGGVWVFDAKVRATLPRS